MCATESRGVLPAILRAMLPAVVLLSIASIPLLAGIGLIARGRRGRQIDDHPICRRCGFDLIGLPHDVHRCSECGADLRDPRSIIHGRRVRRTGLIFGGAMLVISTLAFVAVPLYMAVQQGGLTPYKPVWWLVGNAKGSGRYSQSTALRELVRRARARMLDDSNARRIADETLVQQQSASPWLSEWGDLMEILRSQDLVDDERWKRYMRQAVRGTLAVRPIIGRHDVLPFRTDFECRLSSGGLQAVLTHRTAFDEAPQSDSSGGMLILRSTSGSRSEQLQLRKGQHIELEPGPHKLHVMVRVAIISERQEPNAAPPVMEYEIPLQANWTLASTEHQPVTPIDDPSVAAAIEAGILVSLVRQSGKPDQVSGSLSMRPAQYPLAFEVFARQGDREVRLTSISLPAGDTKRQSFLDQTGGIEGNVVDLIFRPSADVARRTVDMTQYWNGTIEIKDVPITKSR